MLGSVGGRHVSTRRRGSNPLMRGSVGLIGYGATGIGGNAADGNAMHSEPVPRYAARRRRAVTTSDHKSCALIQTRLKLGDIMKPFNSGNLSANDNPSLRSQRGDGAKWGLRLTMPGHALLRPN
ncbi:hypothetical protein EAG_05562 [Camponotus floridanus]|uniref:Uncharacterized protein n=1 Tax=Camponotus floridanus TaxID=104421 RepID=E1ZZQ9_CAMFO|nr:hypothetical protein EAG_05562 [Camponotus floridanus]